MIALRSVGESPGANSTSCVITKPAGLTVGDLMIAQTVFHSLAESPSIPSPPDGWTLIRQDRESSGDGYIRGALFWKIADADDVAADTFTFSNDLACSNRGAITAWTGHDTTTPINASNGLSNAASTTVTSTGVTPTVANCVILMICGVADNNTQSNYAITTDNPASWTEAYDLLTTLGDDCALAMGYALRPETSATGNGTATTSASDVNVGQLVAIAPAVAAAGRSFGFIIG